MLKTKVRIFAAIPRNPDPAKYVRELMRIARFSDLNGFAGILLFTANDIAVEPWCMAQHLLARTANTAPLIAVNPVYMHPFMVAKLVSSLTRLYQRKLYLNMVTGTSRSDWQGLGENYSHSDRYLRLSEFIHLMRQLLTSTHPVSFKGRFYRTDNLQLLPGMPSDLMPELLIAGQSDDAHHVAVERDCLIMQMLTPNLDADLTGAGVNFGIFARTDRGEARRAARKMFPDNTETRKLFQYTMTNTDSTWKRRLNESGQSAELHENGYWLLPFLTYQADCPYLVGSYAEIGSYVRRFAEKNVTTIILDTIANESELSHTCKALAASGVF